MNVHVSYKAFKTPDVEQQLHLHIEKVRKRLQVFRPELIHLHVTLEHSSAREGASVSLNLRLPSGQMAASSVSAAPGTALKASFQDLQEQVTKHKARLREKYKRSAAREGGRSRSQPQVPFEETMAAVKLPTVSSQDVTSWVDANLLRLRRFADRELSYREANGQLQPGSLTPEELINETIAAALGDNNVDKPERLALEPWLYRLAMRYLDRVMASQAENDGMVSLQQAIASPNVQASDEAQLQFYQPDEAPAAQDEIADGGAANPEEIAYSDEILTLVETVLRTADSKEREAFLLYAVEGFSPEEIAAIGDRPVEQVRNSIVAAREHLRRALPVPETIKKKLLQQTKIA